MSEVLLDYNDFGSVCKQLSMFSPNRGSALVEDYSYKVSISGALIKQSFYWAFLADIELIEVVLPDSVKQSDEWWDITLHILTGDHNNDFDYILSETKSGKAEMIIRWLEGGVKKMCFLQECNEELIVKLLSVSLLNILEKEVLELKAEIGDDKDPDYYAYRKKQQVISANRKAEAFGWEKKIAALVNQ